MRTSRDTKTVLLSWVTLAVLLVGGCATVRPVPTGSQLLAQAVTAGVIVSVPRLDEGDYPGDMLDVSTAVLVIIENRGQSDILIDPEGFLLGPVGGMQLAPVAPQQLALKQTVAPASLPEGTLLAVRGGGGGGGGFHIASPTHIGPGGGVRVGPPPRAHGWVSPGWRGGYGFRGYSRWGWWAGGPLYWGPTWGGLGWYGSPLFWPWFYDGPRYYAWSRADAIRLALPAGRLPPGGRTGGFLYFPRMDHAEGVPLLLQWSLREANSGQVIGSVQLPLEMRAD